MNVRLSSTASTSSATFAASSEFAASTSSAAVVPLGQTQIVSKLEVDGDIGDRDDAAPPFAPPLNNKNYDSAETVFYKENDRQRDFEGLFPPKRSSSAKARGTENEVDTFRSVDGQSVDEREVVPKSPPSSRQGRTTASNVTCLTNLIGVKLMLTYSKL